jgi:LysM domain
MTAQANILKASRISDVGRGALALAVLGLLVAGVPAGLLAWAPSPLPSEVPSLSEVAGAVRDTYIPDDFLVGALALICWLIWVELVLSLLVEAVAYARGRKAGPVPLAGGVQRAAARLVAGVALLGAVAATRSAPAPMAIADRAPAPYTDVPLAVVVDDPVTGAGQGAAEGASAEPETEALPTYEVQRRDTLWDIAERHLGDPFRWQEIFRLNEGCPQADGRCLTDPDLIYEGWRLDLPADAVGLAPVPSAPAPSAGPGAASPAERSAPQPTAPASAPASGVGVAEDGGMVLVDDGTGGAGGSGGARDRADGRRHKAAGGVVLTGAAGPPATEPARPVDGMVLLPDRPAADDLAEQGAPLRPTDHD